MNEKSNISSIPDVLAGLAREWAFSRCWIKCWKVCCCCCTQVPSEHRQGKWKPTTTTTATLACTLRIITLSIYFWAALSLSLFLFWRLWVSFFRSVFGSFSGPNYSISLPICMCVCLGVRTTPVIDWLAFIIEYCNWIFLFGSCFFFFFLGNSLCMRKVQHSSSWPEKVQFFLSLFVDRARGDCFGSIDCLDSD